MRKILALAAIASVLVFFSNCHSGKKAQSAKSVISYESGVQTLVAANCSPCHIPSKGGNKLALDNYAAVKTNIDDIIHRIELTPGTKGFMPFKRAKLSDSTIAVFKEWKEAGMLEK